jgi:hypothetical protein
LTPIAGQAPDTSAAVPWSQVGAGLLYVRDNMQAITDDTLLELTKAQISAEARLWRYADCFGAQGTAQYCQNFGGATTWIDPRFKLNPARSSYIYEWQSAIDQKPDLAMGPLADVFARADGDWSFIKHEPEWDDKYASYVQLFVFNHASIQDREPDFAARDLEPVFRRHLEAVVARAPSSLWYVTMVNAKYDFATSTLRGLTQNGEIQLLNVLPITGSGPGNSGYLSAGDLPSSAHTRANYPVAVLQSPAVTGKVEPDGLHLPGLMLHIQEELAPTYWQGEFATSSSGQAGATRFPVPSVLSVDRQLTIAPIPMDTTRAEALTKKLNSGGQLIAKVYLTIDHSDTFTFGTGTAARGQQGLLLAHVQKADLLVGQPQPGQAGLPTGGELIGTFN